MNHSKVTRFLALFGWGLSLMGLIYAGVFATGAGLSRLALMIPPLVFGGVLCCVFGPKRSDIWVVLGVAFVSGYLLVRGGVSPVWDLARRDLFLIVAGVLAYLSASSALRFKGGRTMFLGGVVFLVFGNTVVAFVQWQVDEKFSFLNIDRVDTLGVSGFYYHRNYLSGLLEIAFPVLVAACVSRRSWLGRLGMFVPISVCVWVCFLTNSRGGFGAMVFAGGVTFAMEYFRRPLEKNYSTKLRITKLVGVLVVLVVLIVGGRYLWVTIVGNRGGLVGVNGSLAVRLSLAGLAFDMWLQNPLWGMGAESFSYQFPKFFVGIDERVGDAEMAHSDYLQLLTDYGIVGLFLVVSLIVSITFIIFRSEKLTNKGGVVIEEGGLWLRSASAGALVAEVVRATIDFNLHIAPNLILFAMIVAGGVNCCFRNPVDTIRSNESRVAFRKWSRACAVLVALGVGGYGLRAGWNEIVAARDWAAIEMLRQDGLSDESALRNYSEKAPSFEVLKAVAQNSLARALHSQSETGGEFEDTTEDWRRVVERHSLDGESLANYARCLDEMKRFEEAEAYHGRALEAVSRRENKYGVIYGVGWHFLKKGDAALQQRRSGEALYLFLQAEEAFNESHKRNFSRKELNRAARQRTEQLIKFLEGARIEPVEVPILDWRSSVD